MSKITVRFSQPIGTIAPEIYGHFAEHIGGVIYDGIWVGEQSNIPNVEGFRTDVLEKFKAINPAVIRWPGGCFAEAYNWRDGVGENRPTRLSWWTKDDGRYETNEFGTHEFFRFCELVGAKPYLAVNITSMTPMDARDWVDYCTSPAGSTTLAKERERNGHKEPFNVPFWGIGNENWGGGGTMTAEQYALTYRYYATILYNVTGKSKLVAGACSVHSYSWAEAFADCLQIKAGTPVPIHAVSLHHYCSGGDALTFDEKDWTTLLNSAQKMEEYIDKHREIFAAHNRKDIKLYVGEWGCMHPKGSEVSKEKYLYEQQSTMRDAVIAAYNLNLFNNRCDFVKMANIAQISNCLHALFLVNGENFTVTPTYYVYDMFKAHQGATCLETQTDDTEISVSASQKENVVTLTLANLSCTEDKSVQLALDKLQGNVRSVWQTTLGNGDMHAHNTFENPDAVQPTGQKAYISREISLPKASVVALTITLA
jgi:alpha-N-arabinofuranosidase